jgi:hypothetical protein
MSLLTLVGMVVALAIIAAGILAATAHGTYRPGRIARWIAFGLVVGIAIALSLPAYDDSGWFAFMLLGIPLVDSVLALIADYVGRWVAGVTWIAALILIAWSLVTALGAGFYFLAPGLVMLVAAVLSAPRRRTAVPTHSP